MNIRLGKPAIILAILGLLSIAAYWYWSPLLALKSMQSAAQAGDADAFNTYVDYPRLRESLKGQFSAIMVEKMGESNEPKKPFAAIASMLGLAMVDKVVDAMVRPETVMRGMKSGQFGPKTSAPRLPSPEGASTQDTGAIDAEQKTKWMYVRKGTDILIAYPEGPEATKEKVGVVFERSGFAHWRVTQFRLPTPAA
jgi:hypothetical protein